MTTDANEPAHATDLLGRCEDRYRLLVEQVQDYAIFLLDPEGRVASWNAGADRIEGYRDAEIIGRHFSAFFPPEDVAGGKPARLLEGVRARGRAEDEGWRLRKDGSRFWAHAALSALHEGGRLVGFSAVTRDLTERKAAEEALRACAEPFRLLVASVKDYAIFLLDPEGRIVSWNEGAERIKGYRPGEIIGKHFSVFYLPEDVAAGKPARLLEAACAEGRVEDEGWRLRKDGSRFWGDAVLTPLFDAHGSLVGFAKVTRDLTERRRAEEQARLLEREKAARAAAEEGVRARDRFLSVASHELRTPLNPLLIHIQLLLRAARAGTLEGPVSGRVLQMLETCEGQVKQFTRLVNDLLDVSGIAAGRLELHREEMDLAALTREVVARFGPELDSVGCAVVLRADEPVRGTWDRMRLEQVVANLLSNALKFGRGKPIEVRVEAAPAAARLVVRDQGPGIAPEHQERIFDRFERGAAGYEHSGLGLGLYVTREILQAHGGSVRVASQPGAGAVFTAELPCGSPPAGPEADAART
jgi:PAS domain S-box-containing protein